MTTDSNQIGQIYSDEEELKIHRIGHDAMMEQDAVHIRYEADVTAHLLDTNGKKIGVTELLDTGAVVSVMPIKTWEKMGLGKTWERQGGRDLWMSFLVIENLNDSDQFISGRDFFRNFDVMIGLNNGQIRIRNPDRNYVKTNLGTNQGNKVTIFLDRKEKLQLGQAVVAIFRMRNLNSLMIVNRFVWYRTQIAKVQQF